jgi:hypothetical protein
MAQRQRQSEQPQLNVEQHQVAEEEMAVGPMLVEKLEVNNTCFL